MCGINSGQHGIFIDISEKIENKSILCKIAFEIIYYFFAQFILI